MNIALSINAGETECRDDYKRCQFYDMSDMSMGTGHDARCLLFRQKLKEQHDGREFYGFRCQDCRVAEAGYSAVLLKK